MNWNALANTDRSATVLQHTLWVAGRATGDARELCDCSEDQFKMTRVVLSCVALGY